MGADGPDPAADLRLFNTMSRKTEAFRPKVEGKVGMYVCGVTAYDLSHIGHARVYVIFDVLYRYLKNLEYEVCYVRNFTDVDDKLKEQPLNRVKLTEEEVMQKIRERIATRNAIEHEKSDVVRKDLAAVGIIPMDSPNCTTWRPSIPLAMQEQMVPMT